MARFRVTFIFIILVFTNLAVENVHAQDFSSSPGQLIGVLTSALTSFMSNRTALGGVLGLVQNSGESPLSQDLTGRLVQSLQAQDGTVGADCLQHVGLMVQGIWRQEDWALRMFDAMAKPPSGLLDAKISWLGDWTECLATQATVYHNFTLKTRPTHPFNGKYCAVKFPLGAPGTFGQPVSFMLGTCLPSTCSSTDVTTLARALVDLFPQDALNFTVPKPKAVLVDLFPQDALNFTVPGPNAVLVDLFPQDALNFTVPGPNAVLVDLFPQDALNFTVPEPQAVCKERSLPLDGLAIAAIALCSVFAIIMTLATLYDVIYVQWLAKHAYASTPRKLEQNGVQKHPTEKKIHVVENGTKADMAGLRVPVVTEEAGSNPPTHAVPPSHKYTPSKLEALLLSFSVFTNGTKLLSTRQPKGALTAVNGIRFLSMTWVIVGHSIMMTLYIGTTDNAMDYSLDLMKRPEFMAILNGTFSVDTFFVLSGLLVTYISMKEIKKRGGIKRFKWGMYYFHRFWRLTPAYMLVLFVWISLSKYVATGPVWSQEGYERDTCSKTWWTNVLYINNLVDPSDSECFGQGWYLANDMQFYVISPLILIPLYLSPVFGSLMCLALLAVHTGSSAVITWTHKLVVPTAFNQQPPLQGWNFYVKPWCRVGPYAIGMFTGYLLYRYDLKMKINRFVNVFLWSVSITLGCLIVYGLYTPDSMSNPLNMIETTMYNAVCRSVWGACVAWVIFSCANGYGGPVNHILSWPGFVPLGRLTYLAYLVHLPLQITHEASRLSTHTMYDYAMVYTVLGDLCMAYGAAFVFSLAFEAPMMGLEKVVFGRDKNS